MGPDRIVEVDAPAPLAWEQRAEAAGLVSWVTKKVRLVVASDPDSPSGKARKAIVTE